MFDKILLTILGITLAALLVAAIVILIVAGCNGVEIDSDSAWAVNPANPASPVHHLLF